VRVFETDSFSRSSSVGSGLPNREIMMDSAHRARIYILAE
jgi:hypothetical protein